MIPIPESHRFLLDDNTRAYAFIATLMADGSPQVTPVWFDVEGDLLRVNIAKGRVKEKNMRARPEVALTIIKMDNPYFYLQLRGKVVVATTEGFREHMDGLSIKYTGSPFSFPEGQVRTIFKIKPDNYFIYDW